MEDSFKVAMEYMYVLAPECQGEVKGEHHGSSEQRENFESPEVINRCKETFVHAVAGGLEGCKESNAEGKL